MLFQSFFYISLHFRFRNFGQESFRPVCSGPWVNPVTLGKCIWAWARESIWGLRLESIWPTRWPTNLRFHKALSFCCLKTWGLTCDCGTCLKAIHQWSSREPVYETYSTTHFVTFIMKATKWTIVHENCGRAHWLFIKYAKFLLNLRWGEGTFTFLVHSKPGR